MVKRNLVALSLVVFRKVCLIILSSFTVISFFSICFEKKYNSQTLACKRKQRCRWLRPFNTIAERTSSMTKCSFLSFFVLLFWSCHIWTCLVALAFPRAWLAGTQGRAIVLFYFPNRHSRHVVLVGNLEYQAQSPDEAALVTAARNFGFAFVVTKF